MSEILTPDRVRELAEQRYHVYGTDQGGTVEYERPDGEWATADNYAVVLASHEALRAERDAMRGLLRKGLEHHANGCCVDSEDDCWWVRDTRAALEVEP